MPESLGVRTSGLSSPLPPILNDDEPNGEEDDYPNEEEDDDENIDDIGCSNNNGHDVKVMEVQPDIPERSYEDEEEEEEEAPEVKQEDTNEKTEEPMETSSV